MKNPKFKIGEVVLIKADKVTGLQFRAKYVQVIITEAWYNNYEGEGEYWSYAWSSNFHDKGGVRSLADNEEFFIKLSEIENI